MKQEDRFALKEWEAYKKTLAMDVGVDLRMPPTERRKLRAELEKDPIRWMQYFFPSYAKYPFAQFHKDFIGRVLEHPEWFEVISWSRELAKSTVTMMLALYLTLTGRKKNVICTSATEKGAIKLITPYREQLEFNSAIRLLYGKQPTLGQWKDNDFKAACGASFMALGAGNSPRGTRNGSVRPDLIIVDDFDTDEDCRNPDTLNNKWEWWQRALYPTRAVSEPTTIIFCGNIIAQDCCIKRAGEVADHWDIVNIRDEHGHSSWPEKNSEEHINRIQKSISAAAFQGEYYNNPISEGRIFKSLQWAPVPPLSSFKFLTCYGDPSYSDRKSSKSSMKALVLIGRIGNTTYVIKSFVAHCTNAEFIDEYFKIRDYVGGATNVYYWMENNKLQDPFFSQVFMPLLREAVRVRGSLNIRGDETKKTDKATRIEATLEPLVREGRLLLNEEERHSPYMRELENQFNLFDMTLPYCADGPDAVEGAVAITDRKERELSPVLTTSLRSLRQSNRTGW